MKSPNPNENKNSGGQKFKNRQPGEKRNRLKADSNQSNSNSSRGFDSKPSKPRESRRNSEGFDSNRTPGFSNNRNESRAPRTGENRGFSSRGNSERGGFGGDDRKPRNSERAGSDRGFNGRSTDRGGSDRNSSDRRSNSRGGAWGGQNRSTGTSDGFKKSSGSWSGGDRNSSPRGGSDLSSGGRGFNSRGDSDRGGFEKKDRGFSDRNSTDRGIGGRNTDRGGFDRNSADRGFNSRSGTSRTGSDNNKATRGGSWSGEKKSTGSWDGSKKSSGNWGGEERNSSPRGGSDRSSGGRGFTSRGDSDRGGFEKKERGFNSRSDSRPSRFGKETGSYSGGSGRGYSKPEFGGKREFEGKSDRSFGKSKTAKKKDNFQETPKGYKGSRRTFGKVQQQQEQSLLAGEDLVRLNRYIANSGICSRREADELISQGLVKVNGEVVTELGTKVRPHDTVKVEDRKVTPEKPVYILLNKPKGYITSTSDPDGRQTVLDLIDLPGKERIYPVGRLDRNTTGVLLLTNDGELSQKLMHPSFEIKKIYRATLDKKPTKEHMLAWVEGVELEDGWMTFEQIGWVEEGEENVLGVEIKSGRNRIVRRMFEHFGYDVTSLDRAMLGEFDKLKLGRGKWRFLTEKEMRYIERIKRMH